MAVIHRRVVRGLLALVVALSVGFVGIAPAPVEAASRSPLLVLGDSLCVGAYRHAKLSGILREAGWEPTVRCLGGQRMDWGLDQVRTMPEVPSTVVVALGTNGGYAEPGFEATASTLRQELDQRGARRVVWVNLADSHDGYALKNEQLSRVAAGWGDHVADWARVARADPSVFHADDIHHSPWGARVWVGLIRDTLVAADPVVGAVHPGHLLWTVTRSGRLTASYDAAHLGDMSDQHLNRPIVGMAATPSGDGYWLVASDGGIFSFGDARFLGSTGHLRLNRPIVGMAATPSGDGYWLVASDGGIFSFGDARFLGSTGHLRLNRPIVGMTANPSGTGYWLVADDGGVFAFGSVPFVGSLGATPLQHPVVGLLGRGEGYALVDTSGRVERLGAPEPAS